MIQSQVPSNKTYVKDTPLEAAKKLERMEELLKGRGTMNLTYLFLYLQSQHTKSALIQLYSRPTKPKTHTAQSFWDTYENELELLFSIEAENLHLTVGEYITNLMRVNTFKLSFDDFRIFLAIRLAAKYVLYSVYNTHVF